MAEPSDELITAHRQTVAALRRFSAIEAELSTLLAEPNVGRVNLKREIEGAIASLIAEGALTATQVVTEIGTVPERPADQFRWLEHHLEETARGATSVLARHQAEFVGHGLDSTFEE